MAFYESGQEEQKMENPVFSAKAQSWQIL